MFQAVGAKVVHIKKNAQEVKGFDVYIGRRISNGRWNLDTAIWRNPYMCETPRCLEKFEKIRT